MINYKKLYRNKDKGKEGRPRGQECHERHVIQGMAKGSTTLCTNLVDKTQDNTRNSYTTQKT
jgi:hypothetical protein